MAETVTIRGGGGTVMDVDLVPWVQEQIDSGSVTVVEPVKKPVARKTRKP